MPGELLRDNEGRAILRGRDGQVVLTSEENAQRLIAKGDYDAATHDDVAAHNDIESGGALGAAGRGAVSGIAGGLLSVPKAVTALGSYALGTEDPLAQLSGRQFLEDVGAIGTEMGGGDIVQGSNAAREQIEQDRALHPYAFGGGEFAGQLAGSAAYGGALGALGKAGAAATGLRGAWAARAAAMGASALEGGALGADAVSEDAWLRDQTATAEHTLAGMGLGALLGGATTGVLAAGGAGLSKLFGRGGRGAEAAEGLAAGLGGVAEREGPKAALLDEAATKVAPLEAGVTRKASDRADGFLTQLSDDASIAAVARQDQKAMREIGGLKGATAETRKVGRILRETDIVHGARSPEKMLERASSVAADAGQRIGKIMDEVSKRTGFVDRSVMNKIDEHIDKFKGGWTPESEGIASSLENTVAKLRETADAGILRQSDLQAFRQELDASINYASQAKSPSLKAMKQLRGIVEGELETEVGKAGPDVLADYKRAKDIYRASKWAETTLAKRVGVRDPANRFFSLTDQGAMVAAFAGFGSPLPAVAAGFANKFARERGAGIVSELASRLARQSVDMAKAPAAAQGTARTLRTLMGHTEERSTSAVRGFLERFDMPPEARSVARRAHTTSNVATFAEGTYSGRRRAYATHREKVAQLATMPDVAASTLNELTGSTLPTVAPKLHAAMAVVVGRAAQYLDAHAPAPARDPNSLTPHLDEPPPVSDSDLDEYAKRVEGVTQPLSLLDDLASGDVDPVKVDAVKTVWPELYQNIRAKVFGELTLRTEPVPRDARKILDIALDANGAIEPTLSPRFMQTMQQAGAQQTEPQSAPPSGAPTNMAATLATRSEKIAQS